MAAPFTPSLLHRSSDPTSHETAQLPLRTHHTPNDEHAQGGSEASSNSFVQVDGVDEAANGNDPRSRPGLLRSHSALNPGQSKSFDNRGPKGSEGRNHDVGNAEKAPEFGRSNPGMCACLEHAADNDLERHGFEAQGEKLKQLSSVSSIIKQRLRRCHHRTS